MPQVVRCIHNEHQLQHERRAAHNELVELDDPGDRAYIKAADPESQAEIAAECNEKAERHGKDDGPEKDFDDVNGAVQ